jgi:hypothetical protein
MRTDDLITMLAADAGRRTAPPDRVLVAATMAALVATALVFALLIGTFRADLAEAVQSPRFLIKLATTISLAAAAFTLLRALSHPGSRARTGALVLLVPAAVVLAGIGFELVTLPEGAVLASLVGTNSIACLVFVPVIGIAPLGVLILALRHAAPTRPAIAGAAAGLLAGAVAATVYAGYCPDDSPLFVSTWYTIGIAALAAIGALAANSLARW